MYAFAPIEPSRFKDPDVALRPQVAQRHDQGRLRLLTKMLLLHIIRLLV